MSRVLSFYEKLVYY